jgi:SAM-dependent methyltransferase
MEIISEQIETKNIDEFLDLYLKMDFVYDHNISLEKNFSNFEQHIKAKYHEMGKYNLIEEYFKQAGKYVENMNHKSNQKFLGFIFKNNLLDIDLDTLIKSRQTLKFLLEYFSKEKNEFTLADLGSGDGINSIGCALFLDKLKRVYSIDVLEEAIKRTYSNINKLDGNKKKIVSEKLRTISGDYLSKNISERLLKIEKPGLDFVLVAYPFYDLEEIITPISKLMKPDGKFLMIANKTIDELEYYGLSPLTFTEQFKGLVNHFNMEVSLIKSVPYLDSIIIVNELKFKLRSGNK